MLPPWVNDFNAARHSDGFLNNPWTLSRPASDYADCVPDSNVYESGFNGINYFPYDLKKISTRGKSGSDRDMSVLRETPFGNTLTTDFAIKLIR